MQRSILIIIIKTVSFKRLQISLEIIHLEDTQTRRHLKL